MQTYTRFLALAAATLIAAACGQNKAAGDPWAQADKILELVNTTTKVQNYDEELMQMITNESEAFFAGQKSAEDVGRLLQSKMTIYINEQR